MVADQQFPKSPRVDLIDFGNFTFLWPGFRIFRSSLGRSLSVNGNRIVKRLGGVVFVVGSFKKEKERKTKKRLGWTSSLLRYRNRPDGNGRRSMRNGLVNPIV
jgi:hypothetical protein